ncbi:MAG: type II toxin-antitoxin system PemK/MazF family toxin [Leptospira sp.]|uniref:type II toxin-antitoxin system PemK/MazF family toxin n=1 Tax=Leptospira sp. TaxID=178 RepID=UPI0025C6F5AF|nr:type II toxin-antitoxin system PemK/MazF family toxin [Leptospira sp.]MBL0953141.1 type II toxin-antitoxin system PemK/MazF family toxin [Leptospira sp.]
MIQPGKICLAELPQVDGRKKKRPILILSKLPSRDHWFVCGVSSKKYDMVSGFDETIPTEVSYFKQTGLKSSSTIKLGFVSYLDEGRIEGIMGELPREVYDLLIRRFLDQLSLNLNR